jgi:hypothetical protein
MQGTNHIDEEDYLDIDEENEVKKTGDQNGKTENVKAGYV